MSTHFDAFFATVSPGHLGQRLCIWRAPKDGSAAKRLIVFVHAFAEEMNKSRRMAALQARAFAEAGDAVLQIDLLGCGDSTGDFGDATWQGWVDDIVEAVRIGRGRHAAAWPGSTLPEVWLWGHRAGCLLAVAAASRIDSVCNFVFWQPTLSGKSVLQQFLRLEAAAALIGKVPSAENRSAKESLAAGATVEVAGYRLAPALAQGLMAASLVPPSAVPHGRIEWLDIVPQERDDAPPVTKQALSSWHDAGWSTNYRSVVGAMFWQTTEIEEVPQLISATLTALTQSNKTAPTTAPTAWAEAA